MVLSTKDVRERFIQYFKKEGHQEVASSPVLPHDDPTLLFTNAGMNQFKDIFLGKTQREYSRAVTSQKCIRAGGKHNDLENVGHTSRHLTFFEMMGNFSFGDYFKKEAIRFAWEVSTKVFQFEEDRIWPTVFQNDDEAFELWKTYVPASRITRFGEKENFWAMGEEGPCGPCSELLYDRGIEMGNASNPSEDATGERFLEFWNLVFMQYNRHSQGKMDLLPRPSIDTGTGLERVMSLIQKKDSVFETDILRGLISSIERHSGKAYDIHTNQAAAFRVIADHTRTLSFAIADGVQPSNVDRGYVLRKILRRAVRYGKQLGFSSPFLAKVFYDLIPLMGDTYKELKTSASRIEEVLTVEEEAFFRTLKRGGNMLSQVIDRAKEKTHMISGDDAFLLKDTYGLPFEEIRLIAIDNDVAVDCERFQALEEEARLRSKAAHKVIHQTVDASVFQKIFKEKGESKFLRHPEKEVECQVVACLKDGKVVDTLEAGDEGIILVDKTPFYAEMGGQVGDKGVLQNSLCEFHVTKTDSPYKGIIAHHGIVTRGFVKEKDLMTALIDQKRREKIEGNHTATHLLHFALHELLGEHVKQSGSSVDEEGFRFDFSHHKALGQEELDALELRVNQLIREDYSVEDYELSLEEVQKRSDIKQFFGEKYGQVVRAVEAGPSKELCGGTHISKTGKIGYFRIVKESSIAAGLRRIEAVTGEKAIILARSGDKELQDIASFLKVPASKIQERLSKMQDELKEKEKELKELKQEKIALHLMSLSPQTTSSKRQVVYAALPITAGELKIAAEEAIKKFPNTVIILGSKDGGKAHLFIKVPEALIQEGVNASSLLKEGLSLLEGSGGGRQESAQGAGKHIEKLHDAFLAIIARV